jgi:hypothetical protein
MKFSDLKFLFFFFFSATNIFSQSVVINEFMSSNNSVFPDDEGQYYDWIEIYNSGNSILDLSSYYLSDDTTNIFKWQLPNIELEPDSFLVFMASGKNKREITSHWETIINWGDNWHYYNGSSNPPPQNWNLTEFNESLWSEGPSGFGFGDSDDATVLPSATSIYIRKKFVIDDIGNINEVLLHIDFDDAFVAYFNGVEIARSNIGIPGIPPGNDEFASTGREAMMYGGGTPEKFVIDNWDSILVNGENVLAIQAHNISVSSSDMSVIPFLTFGMKNIPEGSKGSPDILNLKPSNFHTNFKLNPDGEYITFSNAGGNEIDKIYTGSIPSNISKGRYPDGAEEWFYYNEPTPGFENSTNGFMDIEEPPLFSEHAGFYQSQFSLTLSGKNLSGNIFYTTDGSEPDKNSSKYTSPLLINSTTVVRAKVISQNSVPSKTVTNTYFVNENFNIPVVSLSTDPENFWDEDIGIYTLGNSAESQYPYFGANFWEDWERPVHIELFEPTGDLAFSLDAGAKIYGGWSRGHAQKSLAVYARSAYGESEINYKIFPELPVEKFESIVLRNSGNDWDYSMIRDALMCNIAAEVNIDVQAYRPAVVFINGSYWGIHNVREKINEHFISSHYNIDPDSINLLENESSVIQGDNSDYLALLDFLKTHNLGNTSDYEFVKNEIDINNFVNYMLCQIYYDNTDWPGNNVKFWRSNSAGSKWRWILYDSDFGFGLYDHNAYQNNTLSFATATNGPDWPNPPWSTLLLRKLLESSEFKTDFINRYADFSNSIFKPQNIIKKINDIVNKIKSEMERHRSRWGHSYQSWLDEIQYLPTFTNNRREYLQIHFQNKFNLNGMSSIEVNADTNKGRVKVNSLIINEFPWTGSYYNGVPITLSAIPLPGFKFSHWEGYSMNKRIISVLPENISGITAYFIPDTGKPANIVINEINYNSSDSFNSEDWVELYNNSDSTIDISAWIFKDEVDTHNFLIPDETVLLPEGYMVLCRDSILFSNMHPECENFIGNFDFGFDGDGELLRLYNNNLGFVDSVRYDDESPWVAEPDGNGPTLSLVNPDLDNYDAQNWKASLQFGTPGRVNDVSITNTKNTESNPTEFKLEQNYPNPFNPSTTIRYSLKKSSNVRFNIYNLLGQKVRTLKNSYQNAGEYFLIWDGEDDDNNLVSSGIYIYTLQTEEFNMQKKMVLIR